MFIDQTEVTQISDMDDLKKGDLILVRSDYAYEKYGDHLSWIVGGKIQKERGIRPNLITFPPSEDYKYLLDQFKPIEGKVILKVNDSVTEQILKEYGLHLSTGDLFTI